MKRFIALFVVLALFPVVAMADDSMTLDMLVGQVLEFMKNAGGMSAGMKIAGIITLLISTMKVSFLRSLIWDKLGSAKAILAPLLSLIAGLVIMEPITLPGVLAYLIAGAGSIAFHELLDVLKSLPGLSGIVSTIIDLISKLLGGSKA